MIANHDNYHAHLILYSGVEIIGYVHLQFYLGNQAILHLIVIDEKSPDLNFESQFLALIKKWLRYLNIMSLLVKSNPDSFDFFKHNVYNAMLFDDLDDNAPGFKEPPTWKNIMTEIPNDELQIRFMLDSDVAEIVAAFTGQGSDKPKSIFNGYLAEAENDQRVNWVAHLNNRFEGYIILKWHSRYQSFRDQNIPEIKDLNVLPHARNRGIASMLMEAAEFEAAKRCPVIGIGVGLYGGGNRRTFTGELDTGYGAAQRLYIKRGYIPDGLGLSYNDQPTHYSEKYPLDDDLVLMLTKNLL